MPLLSPTGWLLLGKKEFDVLLKAAVGTLGKEGYRWNGVAEKLKSASGWLDENGKRYNYDDAFVFSMLPVGISS